MPDLDLIKQAEQGVRDGQAVFAGQDGQRYPHPNPPPLAGEGMGALPPISTAATSAASGGLLGLEIRHRGIPRSQIPLHGRHRPLMPHCSAPEDEGSRKPSHPVLSHLQALRCVNAPEKTAAVIWA